ncbi:conserved hypothetical protein [Candidatus Desulfosporosinus infrequens]|uniref:Uncharacterized protein n=1 Tax=Candidatus Desulfosporosinus infrequens TaxID=2043169 RepID=A0A2U3L2U2_9FIRM|nr:conserved hypothetical protein [Candidatus Desulfosporosinus infrequens]
MEGKILQAIEGLNQKIDKSIESLRNDFNQKFDILSNQVQENMQILKALEHLAEVNKAEHDKMAFDIAEISCEVKSMRKDLSNVELITASNWGDIARLKSVK